MASIPWLPARRAPRGATDPTIVWQPVDTDGEPANLGDGSGDVTVSVTRADGTAVTGVGTVTNFNTTNPRTATLPAAAVASIDWLRLEWSYGGNVLHEETVEVVGGTLGSFAEITTGRENLARLGTAPVLASRLAIEDVVTRATHRSPFLRFYTERLDGTGTARIVTSWPDLHEVVWARIWDGTTSTALTAGELAALVTTPAGIITRADGNVWTRGVGNIEIGYRFGWTSMPHDLRSELHRAIAHHATSQRTAQITDRATSMSTFDGVNYTIATPGTRNWTTGLPDVDEKLMGYRFHHVGIA